MMTIFINSLNRWYSVMCNIFHTSNDTVKRLLNITQFSFSYVNIQCSMEFEMNAHKVLYTDKIYILLNKDKIYQFYTISKKHQFT